MATTCVRHTVVSDNKKKKKTSMRVHIPLLFFASSYVRCEPTCSINASYSNICADNVNADGLHEPYGVSTGNARGT